MDLILRIVKAGFGRCGGGLLEMTNESVGIVLSADLDVSSSLKGVVEKQEGRMADKCEDNALCVFEKRGPKMFNFELLFLHGFSSKNCEILNKAVLTSHEYNNKFFGKKI